MPRSRSSAKRRGGQSQGDSLSPLRGFLEALKNNRVLQFGALGLFAVVVVLFLMVRACSDEGGYRRVQAAAKEMEEAKRAAGIEESEQQPGAKPPTRTVADAKGKKDAKATPAADGDEVQQPGARPPNRPTRVQAGARPGMPAAAPVALPEKFTDWTEKEFLLAKSAGDRRLAPALQDYIQRAKGTESDVKLYVALLRSSSQVPVQPVHSDDDNPRQRRTASSGLPETLVAALAANGTASARETLRQLLAGDLKTDDERATTTAVLRTLAERPGQDNEELLYQVLAAPDKLRPPGQGSVNADTLQATACDLVRRSAGGPFRVRIANAAVSAATPDVFRKRLRAIVEQPDPRNTEAQIVLYQGGALDGPARAAMDKRLAGISGEALASLLGIPNKTATIAEADLLRQAGARLWSEPFASWLAQQPQRIESMEEGAPLLTLAATVPSERVRVKLQRTLERYVDAGPSALAKTGMTTNVVTEPGFLVALKSVERYLRQSGRGDSARSAAAIRSEEAKKQLLQRQEQREETAREWNEFSESVLRAWCRRLHAAATNGGPQSGSSGEVTPSPIKLAFRTHADGDEAQMAGAYRFDSAGASGDGRTDRLDYLQIRYARVEGRTRISRLVEFYRRQLDCEVWSVDDGVWLDCLLADPSSGRRRSLDVLITSRVKSKPAASRSGDDEEQAGRRKGKTAAKAAAKTAGNSSARPKWKPGLVPDDEEELIVDILSIEVNLPEE